MLTTNETEIIYDIEKNIEDIVAEFKKIIESHGKCYIKIGSFTITSDDKDYEEFIRNAILVYKNEAYKKYEELLKDPLFVCHLSVINENVRYEYRDEILLHYLRTYAEVDYSKTLKDIELFSELLVAFKLVHSKHDILPQNNHYIILEKINYLLNLSAYNKKIMLYTLKNIIKYSIYGDYAKFIYNNYFEDREIKELLKRI